MVDMGQLTGMSDRLAVSQAAEPRKPVFNDESAVRARFQEFAAGTFYAQMFKAMRSTQNEAAYFHGGQTEQIFQGQLDQLLTESLAKEHGAAFAEPLFSAFSRQQQRARIRTEE